MRVGIDASNLRAGGGVTHIVELLRHAEPSKHGITRVTIWSNAATRERIEDRPWLDRVHEPMLDGSLLQRVLWQRTKLAKRARAVCDVIFAPGGSAIETFHPYVTMSQNMLPFDPHERARYGNSRMHARLLALRALQGRAFRNADAVIFLNDYARERIGDALGIDRARTAVIAHGVGDHFRLQPRSQRPLASYTMQEPFRFLYTSIIDVYKHQWNVADAILQMRRQGLPVALDLVGPSYPPARKKLETVLAKAGEHRDAIRVHGEVTHAEISAIYQRADAFVFASTCENLPIILIEAMAAGLPIASSNKRPMPDVLGDAGVYFDAGDPASIQHALGSLAGDASLRDLKAKTAFERATRYSWRRCADETFALLASVGRMRDAKHLKNAVHDHWERETAGTRYSEQRDRREYFDEIADARYRLEPFIPSFADFPSANGLDVLEIGVGAGTDFSQWCRYAHHATGIDLTERAITLTEEHLALRDVSPERFTLRQADAERLPFADASFDLVYSWGVLHHTPDTSAAFREVQRVLRPGGRLKAMVYHVLSWTGLLLAVRYRTTSQKKALFEHLESPGTKSYTLAEARRMVQNAGFEDVMVASKLGPSDLLTIRPSTKYRSALDGLVFAVYPRWLVRRFGDRFGLYLTIKAKKPG